MCCRDEILRVQKDVGSSTDVIRADWIHVMNRHLSEYPSTGDAQITAVISHDDKVSNSLPLWRTVKELVHVTVKPESLFANHTFHTQILIPLFECRKQNKFRVTFNTQPGAPLPLLQDPKRFQEILSRIAVGRWGTPDDLVGPVLMLCSEAGSYCNGLVMPVDGGYLAR